MPDLPTGTVTFLFTDIEESTKLLDELGDAYADALEEHRRVLREVFATHGGVEVDTQGDAFFVAFARASDAAEAGLEGERVLDVLPLRVRMGLHTGEPLVRDDGYALPREPAGSALLGDVGETSFEVQGVAMARAGRGNLLPAAHLGGGMEALCESVGLVVDVPFWNALPGKHLQAARVQLGAAGDAAWAEGRALSLEEAVELALADEP